MKKNKTYQPYMFVIIGTICWYALGLLIDLTSGYIQDVLESILMLAAWTAVPFFLGHVFVKTYQKISLRQSSQPAQFLSRIHLFVFAFLISLITPFLFILGGALAFRQPIEVSMPWLFLAFVIISNSIFALFFLWGAGRAQKRTQKTSQIRSTS